MKLDIEFYLRCSLELGYLWGYCWDHTSRQKGAIILLQRGGDSQVLVELQKTSVYNIQSDQFSEQLWPFLFLSQYNYISIISFYFKLYILYLQ